MQAERQRRGWSRANLSKRLQAKGLQHIIPSTVAKIESGERAARIDEANALADVFAMSVDEMLGRSPAAGDLVWTASRMTNYARDNHMGDIIELIESDLQDVRYYATFDPPSESVDGLIAVSETALAALEEAKRALDALAETPVPGVTISTREVAEYEREALEQATVCIRPEELQHAREAVIAVFHRQAPRAALRAADMRAGDHGERKST